MKAWHLPPSPLSPVATLDANKGISGPNQHGVVERYECMPVFFLFFFTQKQKGLR